jgi:hypothetical protein
MSHFANVQNGIVTQVIVAEQDFIDTGLVGDPANWIQTSYNTRGNVHYAPDSNEPDGGIALRANYGQIGYTYDTENDVFYPPRPSNRETGVFNSWTCNASTNWIWTPPIPKPTNPPENSYYKWNEDISNWELKQKTIF